MKRLLTTLSLALCCLCTTQAFALSPAPDECGADLPCPAGQACEESEPTCVEWPNPGDEECFTRLVCVPTETTCTSNEDCAPGQECSFGDCPFIDENGDGISDIVCDLPVEGVCVDAPTPPGVCATDADCASGEYCVFFEPYFCECPVDENGQPVDCDQCDVGQCLPQPDPATCVTDADCGPDQTCEVPAGCTCPFLDEDGDGINDVVCDCPTVDLAGQCVDKPDTGCQTDAECGPGEVCQPQECVCPFIDDDGDGISDVVCDCPPVAYGQCVPQEPAGECSSDADCADDEQCTFYENVIDCVCPPGAYCECPPVGGVCEPKPVHGECRVNSDCEEGFACVAETQCYDTPCAHPNDPTGAPIACEPVCEETFYCEPKDPAAECAADADCADGQTCQEGVCIDEFTWGGPVEPVEPTEPLTPLCSSTRTNAPAEGPLGLVALLGLLGFGVRRRRQQVG